MHQMLEDSIPASIHATSPNCHNDPTSEGAYGFSDLLSLVCQPVCVVRKPGSAGQTFTHTKVG